MFGKYVAPVAYVSPPETSVRRTPAYRCTSFMKPGPSHTRGERVRHRIRALDGEQRGVERRVDPVRQIGDALDACDPLVAVPCDGLATEADLDRAVVERIEAQVALGIPLDKHGTGQRLAPGVVVRVIRFRLKPAPNRPSAAAGPAIEGR